TDFRIYLWDFHQEDVTVPIYNLCGPKGNVFTIAFSSTNHYLYSAGTDETVLKYNISTVGLQLDSGTGTKAPDRTFRLHDDTIRAISCHSYQEEVFMSAGQDGRILLHDGRDSGLFRAQSTLQLPTEATGVRYHPTMEHIFATCDSHGGVCLRDTRMAFGPLLSRTREGVIQKYLTKLTRKTHSALCEPESSSLTFNSDGSKLAVVMLNFLPTIYGLSDPIPLAVCSGKNHPDGTPVLPPERTYSNSCTIKNGAFGSFGLVNDEFYCAGSEDFRGYMWKVPSVDQLVNQRIEVSAEDWASKSWPNVTAFTCGRGAPRYIPVDLSTPHCYLHGHKSIVNSVLCHPHLFHVMTCGIEDDIILHSPTPTSPCAPNLQHTSTDVRVLEEGSHQDWAMYLRALVAERSESEMTPIRMFDHILREEGNIDVFDQRQRASEDSSTDEMESMDEGDGDND
ncbi:DDB1- and CUL4-associated factor 5, partial [Termitomyces sp. T112]